MKIGRYADILSFLFHQLPMYQRVGPKAFKKDLKNIIKLAKHLEQPHTQFKSIHIAGTNGKGSVSFFISTLLHELGYKVGLYTSPHYKDYRERIKVNGQKIPKTYVKSFVNKLITEKIFDSKMKPSFFEITVAMAFQYFKDEAVDFGVIETGLGGRLDSTNIIRPELSVITNIGYDHMNFLGNTLELIAGEKAGIIKHKVPVVIGRKQKETTQVFRRKAMEEQTTLSYGSQKSCSELLGKIGSHFPDYQKENMTTALTAIKKMNLAPTEKQISKAWTKGLSIWGYMGRYQLLSSDPKTICDSAHNEMGLRQLFVQLEKESYEQLHIVLAMVGDKDLSTVLSLFPKDAKYYISQAKIPRALDKEKLQEQLADQGITGKLYSTIPRALAYAKQQSSKSDLILVTGSIFTVAEVV